MSSKYVIETGIPIPPIKRPCLKGKCKYPVLKELPVGGSVFLSTKDTRKAVQREQAYIGQFSKRNGLELTTRRVDGGIRVWRTA